MINALAPMPVHALRRALLLMLPLVLVGAAPGGEADHAPRDQAVRRLKLAVPSATVQADDQRGVAAHIARCDGFLTGRGGKGGAVRAAGRPHGGLPEPVAGFMDEYPALLGGDATALAEATVARDHVDPRSRLRCLVWQQRLDGIPVHEALLQASITADDELVSIGSRFVPGPAAAARRLGDRAAIARKPPVGAERAFALALAAAAPGAGPADDAAVVSRAADAEATRTLASAAALGAIDAHLVWYPAAADDLRLAWKLVFTAVADNEMHAAVVDARSGEVLELRSLTARGCFAAPDASAVAPPAADRLDQRGRATARRLVAPGGAVADPSLGQLIRMRVFTGESPTPLSPGWPTPTGSQPPEVARELVELTDLDPVASPNGWVDGVETRGNNVDAHTDLNNDNQPDLPRPQGSGSPLTFDFPCDLTQPPSSYRDAAVVNLFYLCNRIHDRYYGLGFTESAGNFQNDTFGRGGVGNDAVQADAQDGGGTNNANFSTPPDGSPGRMQMYLWPSGNRDGDLDATIVIHEYTHGLSNRLVGGGVGISALQSAGMGEGWSDFYALCLLSDPADDVQGTYAVGAYAIYNLPGYADNYYRGIRRYPYAIEPGPAVTSASRNPLTFGDIAVHSEVHASGEVWCMTLWEARANLVARYGGAAGNELILRLVTDGMKLSPANPNFLQARDAILQADLVDDGGANQTELWRAFAKRGMGYSATSPASSTTSGVAEAFDLPGDLRVAGGGGLAASGNPGGPFTPSTITYTVRNARDAGDLAWTAGATQPWVTVAPSGGTLSPGASAVVVVTINDAARSLPVGSYGDSVTFTNATSHSGDQVRAVSLRVASNYDVALVPFAWIDPATHPTVTSGDDTTATQALPFAFTYFGQSYSQVTVSANGMVGFAAAGMGTYTNTDLPDASAPNAMICPWWDDLYPPQGGRVTAATVGEAPDRRFVVSWIAVPHYSLRTAPFTFQVILEERTGDIVCQYLEVQEASSYGAGRGASIGVEDQAGSVARRYSFNGSTLVHNGDALRFSIPRPNRAPSIAAGADQRVVLPGPVALAASVADDGLPNPPGAVSVHWTASGPGAVAFADPDAASTSASFAVSGRYVLTATASDGALAASDDLVVDVDPADGGGDGTGLLGQYWSGHRDFVGDPTLTRTDATVDFDWGSGSPDPSVTADTFTARWSGQVQAPTSEAWTFTVTGDDGVRLWVDGQLVVDAWYDQAPTEHSGTIALTAGRLVDLRLEYYENGGGAVARLAWSTPTRARAIVPQAALHPASAGGTGLLGEYWSNQDRTFAGPPTLARTDATVDFDWGGGSPDATVSSDAFTARWTGQVEAPTSEAWTFTVTGDDGVRLWVDGQLLVDAWYDQSPTEHSGTIALTAGRPVDLRLEYYENGGGAVARLAWSTPTRARAIVPQAALRPATAGGTGVLAEYWSNQDRAFVGPPTVTRIDGTVDFDWGGGSPDPAVSSDTFTARWSGEVEAPVSGAYAFTVTGDDGVRLWVDGALVVDAWYAQPPTDHAGTVVLTAGVRAAIRLEYFEQGGGAVSRLWWTPPGSARAIVPRSALHPPAAPAAEPPVAPTGNG